MSLRKEASRLAANSASWIKGGDGIDPGEDELHLVHCHAVLDIHAYIFARCAGVRLHGRFLGWWIAPRAHDSEPLA
jgi:hypothetical protein